MSAQAPFDYTATIFWQRGDVTFVDNRYSRAHTWIFDGGASVPASASPHVVPAPYSDAGGVDPEEAFVASLSSCHMLWFLAVAAKRNFCVEDYRDQAVGVMGRNSEGKYAMTHVTLHPAVRFAGDKQPSKAEIIAMHERAHEECFIAHSVKTEVRCEPVDAQ